MLPFLAAGALLFVLLCVGRAARTAPREGAAQSGASKPAETSRVQVVQHGGYPELRVDGVPFFIRSAAFFYYRIPRDQWEQTLKIYSALGINTIDLYIPWNWHEPQEGQFDFDGVTNPRRDLRSLLALIAHQGLKLIARPGPEILNEWRHGGYPEWLLERPEYKMNFADRLEGRYPPLEDLNVRDANAAARGWLENSTHLEHTRKWFAAVAKEFAPFAPQEPQPAGAAKAGSPGGVLLFVQLGDDFAEGRFNHIGPDFWHYAETLRDAIAAAGISVPVFINPTDMRIPAAGSALPSPIAVMGQWYLRPQGDSGSGAASLSDQDAGEIELFTEKLKTQPNFPPVMIEYQAGWYTPADDDHPSEAAPNDTLLSSRLLIANGIHGINYFPLQDTYSPAGYSVPWSNRSYRWNAALAPDGGSQPEMRAVERDAFFFRRWGPQLAASHKRADFGILDLLGAYPQELLQRDDIAQATNLLMRLERLGAAATLSSELRDPEHQPVEQLLADALLLMPVFEPSKSQAQLSERSQRAVIEYVRRGGTLAVFPSRPAGKILDELWSARKESPAIAPNSAIRARWKFGQGDVLECTKDFLSWIALDRSLEEVRSRKEALWAAGVLNELLEAAGVRPSVKISGRADEASELIATQLVTNDGTGILGQRESGRGFLSVTNLSSDDLTDLTIEALSPAASPRGTGQDYLTFHVIIPARQSLLLPVRAPICADQNEKPPCEDEVTSGGAEFLGSWREGKSLNLEFYVPARADVHFHFARMPSHLTLDDNKLEGNWDEGKKDLQVSLPRGPAPRFHRIVKIEMPHKPEVPEKEKPSKATLDDLELFVANAVLLPTSEGAFLRTYPPLIVPDSKGAFSVLVQGENHNPAEAQLVDISVDGPLRGSSSFRTLPGASFIERVQLRPAWKELAAPKTAEDRVLHGTVELRAGHDRIRSPVAFLVPRDSGTTNYRLDFDRDGADEWVLENAGYRLIVSPESGGRAIAFVDKSSGLNLSTSVGMLRDSFSPSEAPSQLSERARGRYGLFNRPYAAEWISEDVNAGLKLRYDAPDVLPSGANIEKTLRFEDASTVRVDYRVSLDASPEKENASGQSFVAVNSFPASAGAGRVTRFCWAVESQKHTEPGVPGDAGEATGERTCMGFVPGAKSVAVPAGVKRVEVQTAGRPGMAVEWECEKDCAQMEIEPKNFSALFRLKFPRLTPGAGAAAYTVRLRVLASPAEPSN